MELDKFDVLILRALQENARLSNNDLAEKIGLSPSPCWRRVKRLEESGIITGHITLLDPAAVGITILAYAQVSLEDHHPETVIEFDRFIQASPLVLECCSTSGGYDFLLKIVSADMTAYETFLSSELLPLNGVQSVNTSFVLNQKKSTTALPLTLKE